MRFIVTAAVALIPTLGVAQQNRLPCGPRDEIINHFSTNYNEPEGFIALSEQSGRVLEIIYNSETGTWTAFATEANGRSCMIDSGFNWQEREMESLGDPT